MILWGLLVLLAVLSAVAFVLGRRLRGRRQVAMQQYAAARGLTYRPSDNTLVDQPWGPPFDPRYERAVQHVLSGPAGGRAVLAFEYARTVPSGDGSRRELWSVTAVRLPSALPELRVRRSGVGPEVVAAYGVHPVALESEQFNRTYSPIAHDRKFATDVLHPRMMEWLLAQDAPGFLIHGPDVVLVRKGPLDLARLDLDIAYLNGVAERIPTFVWNR